MQHRVNENAQRGINTVNPDPLFAPQAQFSELPRPRFNPDNLSLI
jgi:hypothetical protein